jgi:uncharacterized protein (UPF0276 family)
VTTLLGVTWSPVAAAMADLFYYVDIVEAPGWALDEAEVLKRPRLLLHNLDLDVSLADPTVVANGWGDRVAAAVARTGTPWFSMHLGFSTTQVRFAGHMLPESELLERGELFDRIVASVTTAQQHVAVPLLLENLDYCPEGAYEYICEPDFITAVLEATDAGLLLDLGHLQVSASWLGTTSEEMLDRLPLERVVEVHVSSPRPYSNADPRLDDVHAELTDRDLDLLRLVLGRARPRVVVLEYRRDPEQLRAQLLQLGRVLKRRPRPQPCQV